MKKYISLIAGVLFLLFTGCQSSDSQEVSNNNSLSPKITITSNVNNNIITGKFKIEESNNFYTNATFKNISINDGTCKINSVTLSKTTANENEEINFEINATCENNPTITIKFDETAYYMDTSIKSITKSFSKEVLLDINISKLNTLAVANIQPSSATVAEGDSFTFYVYTFDNNNNPVSTTVKISPPVKDGNVIGEFDSYLITTDKNGKGSFTYHAPESINSDEITLTIPVIFGDKITKNLTISIKKSSTPDPTINLVQINPSSTTLFTSTD